MPGADMTGLDFTNVPVWTEADAERLEAEQRHANPTAADVEYALNDLPQQTGDIVRMYIANLRQVIDSVRDQVDRLDRLQYRPGDGDMGG